MGKVRFAFNGDCWYIKLETISEILEYLKIKNDYDTEKALYSYLQCSKLGHQSDKIASYVSVLASIKGESFIDCLGCIMTQRMEVMFRLLEDYGQVCINMVGGMNGFGFGTPSLKNETIIYRENYAFPNYSEKDIRVKKWDGGTHYYAYVGDFQVKDGDVLKWNTKDEAMRMAKKYLE